MAHHALHLAFEALLAQGLTCYLALPLEPPFKYVGWHLDYLQFCKGLCILWDPASLPRLANSTHFSAGNAWPSHYSVHTVIRSWWADPISGSRGRYTTLTSSQTGRSPHPHRWDFGIWVGLLGRQNLSFCWASPEGFAGHRRPSERGGHPRV